jgi:hypothetical protein
MPLAADPRIKGTIRDLLKRERQIDRGKEDLARLLKEIHEQGLYLLTHQSWAAYCEQRHGLSRSRGYQLIDFAAVSTIVDTVENEAQARVLAGLPEEAQQKIAARASANGDTSAAGLRDALIELAGEGEALSSQAERRRLAESLQEKAGKVLDILRRARKRVPGDLDVAPAWQAAIDAAIRVGESCSF